MATKVLGFFKTSLGLKIIMAITGFVVFGFLIIHLAGNLQIFLGPQPLNQYAAFLQGLGAAKWAFRLILLASAVLHVWSATLVTLQSWKARPESYAVTKFRQSNYASRTMRWGGPIIALFVAYHLAHFTFGYVHPSAPHFDATHVYNNVVVGFSVWWVSALYIACMVAIGFHLYHGLWSMFQSLGLEHAKWNQWRKVFAVGFSIALTCGFISIPIAVLIGHIKPV